MNYSRLQEDKNVRENLIQDVRNLETKTRKKTKNKKTNNA